MGSEEFYSRYGNTLMCILEDSMKYAAQYGLTLRWYESGYKLLGTFSISEIVNSIVDVDIDIERLYEICTEKRDVVLTMYIEIYSVVGKLLAEFFPKCKKINKIAKNEKKLEKFGKSFCEVFSGVRPSDSELREELEYMNKIRIFLLENPGKTAIA